MLPESLSLSLRCVYEEQTRPLADHEGEGGSVAGREKTDKGGGETCECMGRLMGCKTVGSKGWS